MADRELKSVFVHQPFSNGGEMTLGRSSDSMLWRRMTCIRCGETMFVSGEFGTSRTNIHELA